MVEVGNCELLLLAVVINLMDKSGGKRSLHVNL